ncbi:MAG: hypothetical protein QT04_C0036G0004 [archaeon GW2011_AR11]|nr:MAG: hypothetical protein QT04_C0036G0004 [archaeon GW2011_AR11]
MVELRVVVLVVGETVLSVELSNATRPTLLPEVLRMLATKSLSRHFATLTLLVLGSLSSASSQFLLVPVLVLSMRHAMLPETSVMRATSASPVEEEM